MQPESTEAWESRLAAAEKAFRVGRDAEGVAILRELTAREYANAPLWHGVAKLTTTRMGGTQAVHAARMAVLLAPDCLAYRRTLADILFAAGDVAGALMHYEIAARIACPGNAGLAADLARVLTIAGLHEDAVSICREAEQALDATATDRERLRAALAPGPAPTTETLALARRLLEEGDRREAARQPAEALQAFTRCVQLLPDMGALHYRIGCLLQDLGEAEQARAHHELAARLQPAQFGAAHNAGKLAAGFGQTEPARRFLGQAHRLRPQDGIAMRLALLTEAIHDSTASIAEARQRFEQGLDQLIAAPPRIDDPLNKADLPTFYLAYHGLCNRTLHTKLAQAFIAAVPGLEWQAAHCGAAERRPGRIRIGFISRFLRTHSIGKVARGLVARLSREDFEVYVLNIPPVTMDETARWIQAHADHWLVIDESLAAAREQIATLELDILFYQDIGMEPYSYLLAFSRLAPVQCVSYGHPDTSGIPNMDYYISNDLYEPPGGAAHYSERLVELHALPTLAYYFRPAVAGALPTRAELGLPANTRLYLCAQSLFKLHPEMDAALRGILERDGSGRIVLFAGECAEWGVRLMQRLRRTLPGVAGRIQFLPRQPYQRFLQLLNVADVVLDTPHFNGMNTSIDAFSVGTPVVTLPTGLQRGRFSQAMYRMMGIEWGVARDADEYAALAVEAATDPERHRSLRQLILERNHLLFEHSRTVEEFERFFLAAHCEVRGRPHP